MFARHLRHLLLFVQQRQLRIDDVERVSQAGLISLFRQLLLAHSSASVPDIRVFSPEYEEIKVCVQIELVPDSDFAYYRHQLNRQISDWLAPWRSDSSQALPIGGGNSNMNDLYVYLANQPYVRKVGTLYALHVFSQGAQRHTRWLVRDDELIPSTPWSVLAPARQHFISPPPQCYGIGQMVVGEIGRAHV